MSISWLNLIIIRIYSFKIDYFNTKSATSIAQIILGDAIKNEYC